MKICTRAPGRAYREPEVGLGLVFLPAFLAVSALLTVMPERHMPTCIFRRLTGRPCPTCGAVRCARALLHGALGEAWRLQPLVFVLSILCVLYVLYSVVVVGFKLPRVRVVGVSRKAWFWFVSAAVLFVLAQWAWVIAEGR